MRIRPAPVLLAVAAAAAGFAAPTAFAVDDDALRDCVARNAIRYSEPGSSAVAQYVEVESACRSALEEGEASGFTIAEGPDAPGPGGDPSPRGPDPTPPGTEPGVTPGAAGGDPEGDGEPAGGRSGGAPPAADPPAPMDEETIVIAPAGPEAAERADAAVGEPPPVDAAGATPLTGTPAWLALLVAAAFVASAGGAGWEARRRRQG